MLGKLLKHEFQATGRVMWVIYAAMGILSVFANISFRFDGMGNPEQNRVIGALMVLLVVLWVLSLVIGGVATIVLIVKRFHQNLLTDEGYLMFTLPGTVHHLVLAKIIVAAVWLMATFAAIALCCLIAMFRSEFLLDFSEAIGEIFQYMTAYYALNGMAVVIELLIMVFIFCAESVLQFYSAMSIGYGFTSHKALWSVVFYFIQSTVLQVVGTVLLSLIMNVAEERFLDLWQAFDLSAVKTWHMSMLGACVIELMLAAVFYFLTTWNLKNRLNLS